MCELLGLNFNEPVTCSFSFRLFRERGERNPDGWGIGKCNDKTFDFDIIKEAKKSTSSKRFETLENDGSFTSKMFIGHVRRTSGTSICVNNTHPFSHKFKKHDFILAHNGTLTLKKDKIGPNSIFMPKGNTDSELFMCTVLRDIKTEGLRFSDFEKIKKILHKYNEFGDMCLLFSEGYHMFAYRDLFGNKDLFSVERRSPYGKVLLNGGNFQIDLNEEKSPSQRGFILATAPLTKNEDWKMFGKGELKVFKNGEIVFSI